ncbi:MAG: hypothetical protein LBU09_02335 [Endomicrobium sp.]|jgi:hypothetical protein|nr:hypothetical protein [Endomicrobium sp.]
MTEEKIPFNMMRNKKMRIGKFLFKFDEDGDLIVSDRTRKFLHVLPEELNDKVWRTILGQNIEYTMKAFLQDAEFRIALTAIIMMG